MDRQQTELEDLGRGRGSFCVEPIDTPAYKRLLGAVPESEMADVGMGKYVVKGLDDNAWIRNYGAEPCLLVWFVNPGKGGYVVSGHFSLPHLKVSPEMSSELLLGITKRSKIDNATGLAIPGKKDWKSLLSPSSSKSGDAVDYREMCDQVLGFKPEETEVYLFGQNLLLPRHLKVSEMGKLVDSITGEPTVVSENDVMRQRRWNSIARQYVVTRDLLARGVQMDNIFDHRSGGRFGFDHTLMDVEKRTIYHCREGEKH